MGSKYPVLPPEQIISALGKLGFEFVSQKGSHKKYRNGPHSYIIPNHKVIAKGTLKSILAMANVELEDFLKLL